MPAATASSSAAVSAGDVSPQVAIGVPFASNAISSHVLRNCLEICLAVKSDDDQRQLVCRGNRLVCAAIVEAVAAAGLIASVAHISRLADTQ